MDHNKFRQYAVSNFLLFYILVMKQKSLAKKFFWKFFLGHSVQLGNINLGTYLYSDIWFIFEYILQIPNCHLGHIAHI